jgi:hypothetical protein
MSSGTVSSIKRKLMFIRSSALRSYFALSVVGLLSLSWPSSAFGYWTLNLSEQRKPAARIVIGATVRDFGEVFDGEELEHVFLVTNAGDAPLELSEKKLATGIWHSGQRYLAVPATSARVRDSRALIARAAPS